MTETHKFPFFWYKIAKSPPRQDLSFGRRFFIQNPLQFGHLQFPVKMLIHTLIALYFSVCFNISKTQAKLFWSSMLCILRLQESTLFNNIQHISPIPKRKKGLKLKFIYHSTSESENYNVF